MTEETTPTLDYTKHPLTKTVFLENDVKKEIDVPIDELLKILNKKEGHKGKKNSTIYTWFKNITKPQYYFKDYMNIFESMKDIYNNGNPGKEFLVKNTTFKGYFSADILKDKKSTKEYKLFRYVYIILYNNVKKEALKNTDLTEEIIKNAYENRLEYSKIKNLNIYYEKSIIDAIKQQKKERQEKAKDILNNVDNKEEIKNKDIELKKSNNLIESGLYNFNNIPQMQKLKDDIIEVSNIINNVSTNGIIDFKNEIKSYNESLDDLNNKYIIKLAFDLYDIDVNNIMIDGKEVSYINKNNEKKVIDLTKNDEKVKLLQNINLEEVKREAEKLAKNDLLYIKQKIIKKFKYADVNKYID